MANTSAIWQQTIHTIYQLSSPSCSTRAIQKKPTLNKKMLGIFWKKVRWMDHYLKNEKTERARGPDRKEDLMQMGDKIRHPAAFGEGWSGGRNHEVKTSWRWQGEEGKSDISPRFYSTCLVLPLPPPTPHPQPWWCWSYFTKQLCHILRKGLSCEMTVAELTELYRCCQ